MQVELDLHDEADTERLGRSLAEHLPTRCVVAMTGTLGAGKTRLVRAIAEACDVPPKEVTSPTFALWQTYHGRRTIHHLDAYRVHDEDEFDALGVAECFETDSLIFIEWASRVRACLPRYNLLEINLDVITESSRRIRLTTADASLIEPLRQIAQQLG